MNRISIATLASLSLLAGCSKNSQQTENPGDAAYAGYTDETPGGEGDDGATAGNTGTGTGAVASNSGPPKPRMGSGARGQASRLGKHRSLVAKKPPVTTPTKPSTRPATTFKPSDPATVSGAVPTLLVAGGVFDVYGTAFDAEPSKNRVTIGGKAQKVLEVVGDRLVVEAVGPASGTLSVSKGITRARVRASGGSKTANTFTVLAAGSGFAAPAKTVGHGLLGALYDVGQASTEMPDFNSVGDPLGYVMMENLDVGTGAFAGFTVGDKQLAENFGLHFQGSLNVVEGGSYEMCLEAGDGAVLFLNGEPLLDNDGTGETRVTCDTVEIEAGEYELQLLYYQNDGDLALRLTWAKDGGAKEAIPASAFFPPENLDALAAALNK